MFDKATCLEEDSLTCPVVERRTRVRYPCTQETSCHFINASHYESQWARVREVSTEGIGLYLDRHIEPETLLLVELRTERGRFARGVLARIVHADMQSDGSWLVGCAFVNQLSDNEVQALL